MIPRIQIYVYSEVLPVSTSLVFTLPIILPSTRFALTGEEKVTGRNRRTNTTHHSITKVRLGSLFIIKARRTIITIIKIDAALLISKILILMPLYPTKFI